jgi:N-acetylglucosaminyldiphosphoundecaprenol N-acetyl-beta-D-mannosaminyltransferase
MTDNGLEWLGRMLIEPRRLWKRYILGNLYLFGDC